ncbi:MAG TPA: RNA polymerase sigma-70 factor [Candidatus Alistipes intestinigallinarum]|uniref:RNA polymerase sigma-70 factor n=1 Tax=Candidatus Alistipes intestinigallinarum TaxID=2838440 RepID=A0A9D1Z1E8_9BACT|nr:RNA polymerase sigma-70 factor [Candidatus Alistipes intestinigallinarum]
MDTELLEGLSRGQQEAFDRLIREYYPRLMGYARLLLDEENARDTVQEVFLYVWEHRSRLHFTAGFQSYLFRICHSRMLDTIKRRKLFEVSDSPFDLQLREDAAWLEHNNDDIVRTICNKQLLERILSLADELPEKRREVFRLSLLHDMSNAEISELLDIPRRTVEGHLYHALRFLRARIPKEELLLLMGLLLLR